MSDLVTVIVPVYNTRDLLKRCVYSIINQTYKKLEIFLIDDGSTDGSSDLCDSFIAQDSRIKVIHQKNSGQGMARNQALDNMHGEYVYFVDSDDYIKTNAIEKMVNALVDNNCDMCICGVINDHIFLKKECPKQVSNVIYNREKLFVSYLNEPYIRGVLCNKLYKRELFDSIRFASIRAREDAEVLYRIYGKVEKAIYIPEALYIQFIRPGSTEQGDFNEAKLYTITIFSQMSEYIKTNLPGISGYAELLTAKACGDVLNAIAQDRKREKWMKVYDEVEKQLKTELDLHKVHSHVEDELYFSLERMIQNRKEIMKNGIKMRYRSMVLLLVKKLMYPFYKKKMKNNSMYLE